MTLIVAKIRKVKKLKKITKLTTQAKWEANVSKLRENPSSKELYQTLKSHKITGEQKSIIPDHSTLF